MTTTTTAATTVVETCLVPPPPTAAALSLPLTFFDVIWTTFHPIRRLLFYSHPCSKSHFFETIVPKLKQSLSLALEHYLPLSGNLLHPSNSDQKPVFRYVPGDSVQLVIAVSGRGFDDLVANHARDADQLVVPVFALRVTLFPDRGICIGYANHHSIGDASSIFSFMKAWSSIAKLGEYDSSISPVFDRSVIKDPLGVVSIFWKVFKEIPFTSSSFPLPTNRVRSTFTLRQSDLKKLKGLVLAKKPGLVQVSSFVVTASYVWSCLMRSEVEVGEKVGENVPSEEMFVFTVDVRGRVDPPVPENYFGNCLGYGMANVERKELVGDEGFVIAAEGIAEDIKNRVNKKGEVLKGVENWMSGWEKYVGRRVLGVSGSPRFDLYGLDFGWGRARKLEVVSIDGESYSMSLCKSNDSDGGLEIGLSLPKDRMEAFSAIFAEGLRSC
ncbi:malonyl-coenzyme:anthocyanin 5-o-glucoside-6'''-o-malonyltransferase [Phtheirospermum japonicum]|uniref:Malonyl-coenzyme:anthocyanin 5-o-glucoside-6'''-o-malonyltransferase n=1 Tax=Phtheirospermum japonicum TaxID=374723 RepID=A0A830BPG4_9LAMI|nr:malonyl-coenzyme:anthocyanin 5-o-glucoside-6'''-o-malonyltransferase [Phtheirospermum japonicum]